MIHPILNFSVTGAIWYQGESNAGKPYQYRDLFPLMIESWRNKWSQENMTFLFVQLANYMAVKPEPGESQWAELREAQLLTLDRLDNTGMAVIIDIGEANDIHPRNKQDVGYRLALNALKMVYNKELVNSGPIYRSVEFEGGKGVISFESVGSGLVAKDKYGYLKGFAIAGADRKFHWAQSKIEGDKVIVWSDDVKNPQSVRYAWADNPEDANLYNVEDLPASPFRTDDWR
jgi:sialate O-acetylesterase